MHSEKIFWAEPLKFINWAPHINDLSVRNYSDRKIEMTHFESGFLCGLLKRERPKKILEVGVAAGGTSAVLLKSISMLNLNAKLYSVDLCHKYYANPSLDVGYIVNETVPDLIPNWKLFTGNIVSEYLEEIGPDIDFCILDTMHTLPGELLDFLCVFPYLKRDAVVVLHDTALHFLSPEFSLCYATQVLMSVVVADKIYPCDIQNIENIPNIGAFKINSNTYRYIENVFYGLRMPWSYIPDDISLMRFDKFFEKYYNEHLYDIFRQAVNINAELKDNKFKFNRSNNYVNELKTSCIITCYNYGNYLKQAVDSCISNNIDEIIIVNDGSSDNTMEIVQSLKMNNDNIILINKKNEGQMAGFRSAFEYTTGDIISFLDADDYYLDFYIDKVKKIYMENNLVDLTFSPVLLEDGTALFEWSKKDLFIGVTHWLMDYQMFSNYWAGGGSVTSGLTIRRSALQTIIDAIPPCEDAHWKTGADNCIIIGSSFAQHNKFFISGNYIYYRRHLNQASNTDKCDYVRFCQSLKNVLDKFFGYSLPTPQNYVQEYLQNCLFDEQTKRIYIEAINKTNYPKEAKNAAIKKIMKAGEESLNVSSRKIVRDIYLCFSCDVKYLQHFVVALTSILHNASQEDHLIIYFISNDLSPQDSELILSLKSIRNFEIKFISVTAERFKAFSVNLHVSIATYFRLLIPEIIPSHVDKILYLDCDIIVEKSLYDLYSYNIDQYYVAAVEDFCSYSSMQYNEQNYRIYREKYFNAGVLLLNLKKLRLFDIYKKTCEFIEKFGQPRWWDQDILNMLFEAKDILFIPPYFNMQYWYSDAGLRADEYLIGNAYAKIHDITIIHFVTDIKPWSNVTFSHASNIFVKKYYFYLRLSCFCGKVQSFPLGIPYNSHILLLGVEPIGLDICKKKILKIQSDAHIVTKFFENYAQLESYYINYNKFDVIFILQSNSINGVGFSYLKENNKCFLFIIDKNCENIIQVSTPSEHKVFGVCEQTPQEGQIPSINSYNFSAESPNKFFANIRNQIKLLRYRMLSKITFGARRKHYKTKKQKLKKSINKALI